MNTKIKNYVDVLFKGIPNTKKSQELREEILSNLDEHFQAHIAEGMSENQAYTESLRDLGDIDELLKDLEPEKDLKEKIDSYRNKRARNVSIAVFLYILSVLVLIGLPALSAVFEIGSEEKMGVIGLLCMLAIVAVATGIIVFTKMSMPQDVAEYIHKDSHYNSFENNPEKGGWFLSWFLSAYWIIVVVIYLGLSFMTGAWNITWLIWLIASAVRNGITAFYNGSNKSHEED